MERVENYNGLIGFKYEMNSDAVLVFQMPRSTDQMSKTYTEGSANAIRQIIGTQKFLMIGCDVNVYELTGADISVLKIKGLI